MALEQFVPELWAGAVLESLKKFHVLASVCNRDYEGEISAFGDEVNINQIGAITVATYSANATTITPQILDDAQKKLKIDQQKYFAFEIDSVNRVQTKPDVMAAAMREASYRLRDASDTYIGTQYTNAGVVAGLGTSVTPIDITSVNIVEYLGLTSQKLSENNVPLEGRWFAIAPWVYQKIVLAKIALDTSNSEILASGFAGRALGFDFYVSNNISIGTASTNADTRNMAGYPGSITFAEQLLDIQAFKPESSFADALKGLYIYGCKVVRPSALATFRADYTVEP
jgi:hypothetical protein